MSDTAAHAGAPVDRAAAGIVLLNYCGWRDTLACVASLLASDMAFERLVICDNASPDGSLHRLQAGLQDLLQRHAAALRAWWPEPPSTWLACGTRSMLQHERPDGARVALLDTGSNAGFAAGNNAGLRWLLQDATLQWFWLLNNDTEVARDTLRCLMREAHERPHVGLWGATVLYHDAPHQVQALGGGAMRRWSAETWHLGAFQTWQGADRALQQHVESRMDYVLGASMFVSRSWLQDVGLLDERYFLYCEELDWALRGRSHHELGWAPQAIVRHKEGATIGTDPDGGSPLSVFHLMRSRLIFTRLRLPVWRWPLVAVGAVRTVARFCVKRRWSLAWSACRGAMAGMRLRLKRSGRADPTTA